jgi:hypothetical protein
MIMASLPGFGLRLTRFGPKRTKAGQLMLHCNRPQLINEDLRNPAQRAILQCEDGDRLRFGAQIKRQRLKT